MPSREAATGKRPGAIYSKKHRDIIAKTEIRIEGSAEGKTARKLELWSAALLEKELLVTKGTSLEWIASLRLRLGVIGIIAIVVPSP